MSYLGGLLVTKKVESKKLYKRKRKAHVNPGENLIPTTNEDFVANFANAYITASRAANGELYVVPSTISNVVDVFYNKSVFEGLGFAIPKIWDLLPSSVREGIIRHM